jgi:hypothetical protein
LAVVPPKLEKTMASIDPFAGPPEGGIMPESGITPDSGVTPPDGGVTLGTCQ